MRIHARKTADFAEVGEADAEPAGIGNCGERLAQQDLADRDRAIDVNAALNKRIGRRDRIGSPTGQMA